MAENLRDASQPRANTDGQADTASATPAVPELRCG